MIEKKVSLADKQNNDLFLLKKQQKIEFLKEELANQINKLDKFLRKHNSESTIRGEVTKFLDTFTGMPAELIESLARTILEQERCKIVFPIGKYKSISVDYVIINDEKYCRWFLYNVRSDELETLKIIDYLAKRLNGYDYWLSDPCKIIDNMLEDILPSYWINHLEQNSLNTIKNKFLIHKRPVNFNDGCIYLDGRNYECKNTRTSYTGSIEISGESSSNEFEYYGDSILGYEDFC